MTEVLDRPDVAAVATAPAGAGVAGARSGRFDYKWIALGVVLLGTIMTILDATIVNIAIPTLQGDLKAGSYADISWVITGYMLAQGAVIPMAGWATDRFGTKRLYLITIALFTLASMACGVAQNLPELVVFRVLQGLGGGMLMPIGMTIIMRAVGPQNMGRVMGIFGIPMLLAPAVGPVLGGWFVQDFSWRLIFYVNVPIGLIAFASAWRFLTEFAEVASAAARHLRSADGATRGRCGDVCGEPERRDGVGLVAGGQPARRRGDAGHRVRSLATRSPARCDAADDPARRRCRTAGAAQRLGRRLDGAGHAGHARRRRARGRQPHHRRPGQPRAPASASALP